MPIEYHHLYYQIFSNSSFSTLLSFGFQNKTIVVYTKKKISVSSTDTPTYTFLLIYYLCNIINHLLGNLLAIHSYLPLFHVVPCRDFSPPSLYQTSLNIYVAVQRQRMRFSVPFNIYTNQLNSERVLCEKLHYIIL